MRSGAANWKKKASVRNYTNIFLPQIKPDNDSSKSAFIKRLLGEGGGGGGEEWCILSMPVWENDGKKDLYGGKEREREKERTCERVCLGAKGVQERKSNKGESRKNTNRGGKCSTVNYFVFL